MRTGAGLAGGEGPDHAPAVPAHPQRPEAACNQTSNREPVVSYDETTVHSALDELKDLRLVRFVLPSHGRSVIRYRQVLDETLALDARQCALLAVLMLRGPQTVGELRTRTERMAQFDGLHEIERELQLLGSRDELLVSNIGRRAGQKEERWATSLVASPDVPALDDGTTVADAAPNRRPQRDADAGAGADDLRAELAGLRADVARLRHELEELRASLGG